MIEREREEEKKKNQSPFFNTMTPIYYYYIQLTCTTTIIIITTTTYLSFLYGPLKKQQEDVAFSSLGRSPRLKQTKWSVCGEEKQVDV